MSMVATSRVVSPGELRRRFGLRDDKPLGEDPIPVSVGPEKTWGQWRIEPNGQWRFWLYPEREAAND